MSKKLRYWQGDSPSLVGDGAGAEDWPWAKGMEMAKIMATMAAKTPNEMFETAIFLYLFLLCYYQKTLSLSKKKKDWERGREREKRQRILEKSETNMQKMVLNVEGRGNGIYIENMNTGIVPIFIGSNMPYGLQFSMPFSL